MTTVMGMKKPHLPACKFAVGTVLTGIVLGLAAAAPVHAANPGIQSVQNVQVTGVIQHQAITPVRPTPECMPAQQVQRLAGCQPVNQHAVPQRVVQPRQVRPQPQYPQVQQPQPQYQHSRQQVSQAQRAQQQAQFAARAKQKALQLAQQRKRAAMLEQQKRRKVQLAQQQQRAAHQAAMLAAKKKRTALLQQQQRRAQQLAQQRNQQAQQRAALLAQQKQHAATKTHAQQGAHDCAPVRVAAKPRPRVLKPVTRPVQSPVQPRVTYTQEIITPREAAQQFQPQQAMTSRRIITTAPAPLPRVRTQPSVRQQAMPVKPGFMAQSVTYHDRYHSSAPQGAAQYGTVQYHRSPKQQDVVYRH